MRVLVVGGAIVDVVARPTSVVAGDTSNEGEITWGAGGAGRNVAENLRRLGCEVTLVTDLADDFLGAFLLRNLADLGIEARIASRARTGLYLAVLHGDGSLDRGFCQTHTERVALAEFEAVLPDPSGYDGAVLDANLGEAAATGLAARFRAAGLPYALETVAHERARRVLGALPGCALVKPDRAEAAALAGRPCLTRPEAVLCARRLREMGAGQVIVSLGAEGLVHEGPGASHSLPALPTAVVDVTGAGDALFAAAFVGLLRGLPVARVLEAGRRAAALACASPRAVSPELGPQVFEEDPA